MTDPITTLASLEPESPPQAVVLSAVRLFRYRVLATVSIAALLVGGLVWLFGSLQGDFDSDVADIVRHPEAVHETVIGTATIANVQVTATEAVTSPAGNAIRIVVADLGSPEREVDLDVYNVRNGGRENPVQHSLRPLSRELGRTTTASWVLLPADLDPIGAEVEIFVLPIPDAIFEEGGVLTDDDGFRGVVTIERKP